MARDRTICGKIESVTTAPSRASPSLKDPECQRCVCGLLLVCVALVSTAHSQPKPADIVLPDLLAVELPPGRHDLGPTDPPLRDLFGVRASGTLKVTADLATRSVLVR